MPKKIIKTIDDFIKYSLNPACQSLKDHIEWAYIETFHISASVLKDVLKRLQKLKEDLLTLDENYKTEKKI